MRPGVASAADDDGASGAYIGMVEPAGRGTLRAADDTGRAFLPLLLTGRATFLVPTLYPSGMGAPPIRKTDAALGLHGLRATDAERLLADWRSNASGRQPVSAQLAQFGDEEDEEIGGGGGVPRRKGGKGRMRNARTMSHMRKSVYAQKETVQLVSVS